MKLSLKSTYIVLGVSGSGKSTIGKLLADRLSIPFYDGDDFHPESNIQKMKSGRSLNDQDREPWLRAINQHCVERQAHEGCVVACSALKEVYRAILNRNIHNMVWVSLEGSFELIHNRIKSRQGHFMPAELLQSQFDTWESPKEALHVDIDNSPEQVIEEIITQL